MPVQRPTPEYSQTLHCTPSPQPRIQYVQSARNEEVVPAVAPAACEVDVASQATTPPSSPALATTPVVYSAPANVDSLHSPRILAMQDVDDIIEEFPVPLLNVRTSELLSDKIVEFPAPLPKAHTSELSTDRIVEDLGPFDAVGSFCVAESDPIDNSGSPSSADFYDPTRIPETEPELESSVDVQPPAKRPRIQQQAAVPLSEWVERAPPGLATRISKPNATMIPKRRIQCNKCEKCTRYSSSRSVKVNTSTGHETVTIRATCQICKHRKTGEKLRHDCWTVVDEPTAGESLYHVQPAYYSVNRCENVVDPANLATFPNASVGSMNQGELWPTGIQATSSTPAVVKGVYCTDTMIRGMDHCRKYHSFVLGNDPHFVIYEIKPSHPQYNNFVSTSTIGFCKCMTVVDVSRAVVNAKHVVITRI
jgi:hypothetical protein